jgi:lipid-A-disaccharide synthase
MPCDYYIIAGEASGDLHGAHLMQAILKKQPTASFRFWGGDKMQAVGGDMVTHYRKMAFMGFWEVIQNISTILSLIKTCKSDILETKPQVLILVDYPGFNMRIAAFAKKHNIRVVWYIAPQVWAWKAHRVQTLKKITDRLMAILPFEQAFFAQHHMDIDYVGHPLLDHLDWKPANVEPNKKLRIALLPGSRKQEIKSILPSMLSVVKHFPDAEFTISQAPSQPKETYASFLSDRVKLSTVQNNELLTQSDIALVASGTATLETALIGIPQAVCYRTSYISYRLAKSFIKVPYISLVNLIANNEVVREIIQDDLNPYSLEREIKRLSKPDVRKKMLKEYEDIRIKLGEGGASDRAASIVLEEYHTHQTSK